MQGCTASQTEVLLTPGSVHVCPLISYPSPQEALLPTCQPLLSQLVLLSPAQSPAAPVDPLQQAYAGMQHYTGEEPARPGPGGRDGNMERGLEVGLD